MPEPVAEQSQSLQISLRDMMSKDVRSVLQIERSTFDHPWGEEDFYRILNRKGRFGVVAMTNKRLVVGYLVVEALPKSYQVLNLAVDSRLRRRRVGKTLMAWLLDQMAPYNREKTRVEVRESNLGMQLFMRSIGFLAIDVIRNYYEDSKEDAFIFERLVNLDQPPRPPQP